MSRYLCCCIRGTQNNARFSTISREVTFWNAVYEQSFSSEKFVRREVQSKDFFSPIDFSYGFHILANVHDTVVKKLIYSRTMKNYY